MIFIRFSVSTFHYFTVRFSGAFSYLTPSLNTRSNIYWIWIKTCKMCSWKDNNFTLFSQRTTHTQESWKVNFILSLSHTIIHFVNFVYCISFAQLVYKFDDILFGATVTFEYDRVRHHSNSTIVLFKFQSKCVRDLFNKFHSPFCQNSAAE